MYLNVKDPWGIIEGKTVKTARPVLSLVFISSRSFKEKGPSSG
jgi:hypothetical protein